MTTTLTTPTVPPTPRSPDSAAQPTATVPPTLEDVRRAGDELFDVVSMLDLDDDRWVDLGPLVAEAAARLRVALGLVTVPGSPGAPPIVHQRDLATAARRLLAVDVQIVDDRAATAFVHLAWSLSGVRH